MPARIKVRASDVWDYAIDHEKELRNSFTVIADNLDYGIEVFLTILEDDNPYITVCADDNEIYSEEVFTPGDCDSTIEEIYDRFLTDCVVDFFTELDNNEVNEQFDMIEERELDLNEAVLAMFTTFADNFVDLVDDVDKVVDDMKDYVAEYLYEKHGLSIYRPMFLEDEDGNEEFTEFPYPELELE